MFGLKSQHFYLPGMNHDSNKSPSLGMISTATRTTATVSPLNPLTNGSAVSQSTNSGFAAALRKLAKQAEDPRGSAVSREPSPVSTPSTSHSSPVTTPKRPSLGPPLLGQSRGHSVPSTTPVVTIAPTKTSNLWRAESRQAEVSVCEHLENHPHPQDKRTPPVSSSRPLAHPYGLQPSAVMQDPRIQSLSLPGQMHPGVPPGAVPEEYLRALRPYATSEELRLASLPLGLDPAAAHAAAAAAYYHPAYLHHPLSLQRMEESLCLSALRSPYYSVPGGGAFPSLHPSALHMHLPGSRYPAELNHTALAERLQMESELRQREHEREREKERERVAKGAERERERERAAKGVEREREREREDEADRQKERHRDRQQQMVRGAESHYLAELQARRAPPEDRPRPGERLTPNRPDKAKESEHLGFTAPKPLLLQSSLHSSRGAVPHPVPSLVPSHMGKHHSALAAAMMTQRMNEEVWLSRQRGQDRERPLELDLRSPGKGLEPWRENQRPNTVHLNSHSKDTPPSLGAPPPLISPKGPPNPSVPPTTLWNPASFVDSPPARKLTPSTPPSRPPPGLTRTERTPLSWGDRTEDSRRRVEGLERVPSMRGGGLHEAGSWGKAEQDRTIQSLYQRHHINNLQQRACAPLSAPLSSADLGVRDCRRSPSPLRERHSRVPDSLLVYDEVLQQHRRLLSKLDLEERRRKEAREGGYYYDVDESYDESDEEEVKAHLRRVTEQPPLKLETSSEKVEFLSMCGLTTLSNRDEILAQKRRKRRRMLRERSPSPPVSQVKKKACPSLRTPYTADQMNRTPELGEKKDFLSMFSLSHVSPAQRREKQKAEELLKAIKKKTVTLDTIRYNPVPPCSTPSPPPLNGDSKSISLPNGHPYPDSPSPSPPFLHKPKNPLCNDALKSSLDPQVARIPTPLAPHHEKTEFMEPNRKPHNLQNGLATSPLKKTPSCGQNGRSRPWEKFTPEVFAQHFHQAVLQSTHSKDGLLNTDSSLPHKASPMKVPHPNRNSQHINGHHAPLYGASRDTPSAYEPLSEEEGQSGQDEEEDEEEEMEEAPRKWQGIEAIFEAYHQYAEEHIIERQVLQSQCRKLEAQNHHLTRTAEQLSHTMAELMSQRQRVREENERLQAQLEHFRRCLTLPNVQWSRGQINGHAPR
ncbi:genetic suppressor element 1-like isoform X1 [Periophthalmus magnuspinnatus]|uniref:genetic suppressor element 1-like isoform X1 n=2 Tax=Periophthalmus magnuspinnatus TaxID=409849 RepID=UPI002436336A|nr:genetic suppressor element 1-like isoform X1 [Periophthalmus magnuspinnatus]